MGSGADPTSMAAPRPTICPTLPMLRGKSSVKMAYGSLDLWQVRLRVLEGRQLDVLVLLREALDDDVLEVPLGD